MSLPPPDSAADAVADQPPLPETASPTGRSHRAPRPGDLAHPWRVMLGLGWISAFFAYAGVWQASVQIGIGTWWIGPRAQPTNIAVKLIPFYVSLSVALLIVYNVRWIVRWSATGVVAAALISIPDFSRSTGLGVAEAILAGLLAVITLASLSGTYRAPKSQPTVASAPSVDVVTTGATSPPTEPPPPGPAPQ